MGGEKREEEVGIKWWKNMTKENKREEEKRMETA